MEITETIVEEQPIISDPAIASSVIDNQSKPKEKQPETTEEDLTKLDLTEPAHLTKFKASYSNYKSNYEESQNRVQALEQEINDIRANANQGVYISTNMPLEDFNPDEVLSKMAEEEPEYYEKLSNAMMQTHFWESVGQEFESVVDKTLDYNTEGGKEILDQMYNALDVVSRRAFGFQAPVLYGIMEILGKEENVALKDEIINQMNGNQPSNLNFSNGQARQTTQYGQSVQVQTIEQIAKDHNLDPTEEAHFKLIKGIQAEQAKKVQEQLNYRQPQQTQQNQRVLPEVEALKKRIQDLESEKQKASTISDEDLTKQAELRFNNLSKDALSNAVKTRYSGAAKGREHLLPKLETLAETRLNNDPNFQALKRTSIKWFKQSAAASTATDRDRWDKKGQDALAAMIPIRLRAVDAEAAELQLGVTKQTKQAPKQTREISNTGKTAPVTREQQKVVVGDIESAKDRIKSRFRNMTGA